MLAATAARYRGGPRFARHYVASKLRRDPVHRALLARAAACPFGTVLDIGCGHAQLLVALLLARAADAAVGLDNDPAKLAAGRRAAAGLPVTLLDRDLARDPSLPGADTVLLVDVLYQLPAPAQHALLDAAAGAARHRLLIRALDPDRGLRSRMALGIERGLRRLWPTSGAHVAPLPVAAIVDRLAAAGLACTVEPCWRGTPLANVLIAATRPG